MAEKQTQGAARAKKSASQTKVINALTRETKRLDRFIARYGDLPIGTPDDQAESAFMNAVIDGSMEGAAAMTSAPLSMNSINPLIEYDAWDEDTANNVRCALEFLADAVPAITLQGGFCARTAHGFHLLQRVCAAVSDENLYRSFACLVQSAAKKGGAA